uniref:NADH dehydrogenase subunit 4L n=1 Tax=Silvatares holzenthali TaxID=3026466 RepID=UPI0023D8057F|nr:NADH dehydrogenase subunit 4L [Silvatares holzenthali]WCR50265.1 NADH dehydrogenase subunit 4L [Silvatares holzenthali]
MNYKNLMKINSILIMFFMNYLIGNFMFSLNRKHLLIILLSLEFIIMNLFFLIYFNSSFMGSSIYFMFFFLVLSVCEGVLGLSILIYLVRVNGNDYIFMYNII